MKKTINIVTNIENKEILEELIIEALIEVIKLRIDRLSEGVREEAYNILINEVKSILS
ncbi:hypothetical protein CLPU_14c00050 [Gottschalkia purinilytica]|uniref:Uncharacterized protein n=1 Tax=Gottschalkia purinilytica TaxID=1503 RepID=A0A0L0W821_GOTPU|nr:hypothetical protein [Gottschalkia purinilytica]KNF07587.1 hypothetical protein CLPU_14c00050 [Gottschalkia purinilytica]